LSDVSIDYRSGLDEAIRHLKSLKHSKIAYIGGSVGPTISDHHRDAFIDAMAANGLKIDPQFMRAGNYRISGGESAMNELLKLSMHPTAVVTANDLTAIGALRALHKKGLSVPADISIVGFDDIELADIIQPPLTTLHLSRQRLAKMFFKALEDLQDAAHANGTQHSVTANLVVRGSTAKARKS
jgi:LacI family transcriptional regulator